MTPSYLAYTGDRAAAKGAKLTERQVVNYRDYPPQDNTYVYKFHPFSSNINDVQYYLRTLTGESKPPPLSYLYASICARAEFTLQLREEVMDPRR